MKNKILLLLLVSGLLFSLQKSFAHCDTKKGPVVTAAKEALRTNNVNLVLIWVPEQDEAIIKEAFKKTIHLRKINSEVQETVDNYFFETLVRIHRAGEGVTYTGLKDDEVEVPIAEADNALKTNSGSALIKLLNNSVSQGVNDRFNDVSSKKNYDKNNVDAGREYVKNYVMFTHYVEAIYNAANSSAAEHHGHEKGSQVSPHKDTGSNENSPLISAADNSSISDFMKYILIISGILLLITIHVILTRRKYALH